ncbi:iron-siderophore ABC transporter ATP-binding protein [Bacillus sp. TS-2]|nr:iron-siderophore ABC transporter ATP-binding protein [Bacillus sp. TS-2]
MKQALYTSNISLEIGHFSLNKISASIPEGKITGIVGPNGSGKSTLLRILSNLQKPDDGYIVIDEKSIKDYKGKELAQTLAMMPQAKSSLPNITVKELVQFGRSPYKGYFRSNSHQQDEQIVEWALRLTNTEHFANRMFHTLSGGEQQKVRIALALVQKAPILLLDEPTTFLDITHQIEVMELVETINREEKMTIVMVLHELQQAASYCDYLVVMKNGAIAQAGKPKELLTSSFLKDIYDIEAKVKYEEGYPLIIPIKGKQKVNI